MTRRRAASSPGDCGAFRAASSTSSRCAAASCAARPAAARAGPSAPRSASARASNDWESPSPSPPPPPADGREALRLQQPHGLGREGRGGSLRPLRPPGASSPQREQEGALPGKGRVRAGGRVVAIAAGGALHEECRELPADAPPSGRTRALRVLQLGAHPLQQARGLGPPRRARSAPDGQQLSQAQRAPHALRGPPLPQVLQHLH